MNESVKTFKNESTTIILYKDNNVVTTKQLAEFYGVEAEKLKYNFNYNKGRYKDGLIQLPPEWRVYPSKLRKPRKPRNLQDLTLKR